MLAYLPLSLWRYLTLKGTRKEFERYLHTPRKHSSILWRDTEYDFHFLLVLNFVSSSFLFSRVSSFSLIVANIAYEIAELFLFPIYLRVFLLHKGLSARNIGGWKIEANCIKRNWVQDFVIFPELLQKGGWEKWWNRVRVSDIFKSRARKGIMYA